WHQSLLPLSTPGSSSPQLAVASNGNAVSVWVDSTGNVQGATLTAGTLPPAWVATNPLTLTGNASNPSIGVDSTGDAVAVWQFFDGSNQILQGAKLTFGIPAWTATSNLTLTGEDATNPNVAVDPAGDALAVWLQNSTVFGGIVPKGASILAADVTWSTPTILDTQ